MNIKSFNYVEQLGNRVRVYRNLHNKLFSVQAKLNKTWKVIGHVENITLADATFKVSEAGRQRVINQKRKNVHAYVEGVVTTVAFEIEFATKITYNPYKYNSFVETINFTPVHQADLVTVHNVLGITAMI
jgi:L-fucose mutarotase/ribose pyranase (RbsD/FucU family)